MEDDKNKQSITQNESNAERDKDEGEMNNGTIGGNMGVIGSSNEDQPESENSSKESKPVNEGFDENSANR